MPLIKIKKYLAPSIGLMHTIVLRCIFDADVTTDEWRVLEDGLKTWTKKADITPEEKWEILRITNALIANELGHWERAKALLKQHNIHYTKLYKKGISFIADPYKVRTYGKT